MEYLNDMHGFWQNRFTREGKVWGDRPSKTAAYALRLFQDLQIRDILVPGAGYGRNTRLFSENGYRVTGVELSEEAVSLARQFDPKTRHMAGSILDMPFPEQSFDAIYCFNVLHLFRERERAQLISKCYDWLTPCGYAFFTAFSMDEPSCGKGPELEKNTFESKQGRPTHYFSDEDIRHHFRDFNLLETGMMEDPENHGKQGAHVHRLAYILAQKSNQ